MYAIEFAPEVVKQVESLHPKRFKQVHLRIFALQMNPRPPDCVMLDPNRHIVSTGPYKILYKIDDGQRRIHILVLKEKEEAIE